MQDPNRLDVLLQWAVSDVIAANYGISLRLHDATGKVWTSLDTQPGYGFQPTSAWQPGTLNDAYTLDLPADLPRDQAYALDVILYRVAAQEEVGRTTIDGLRLDPHDVALDRAARAQLHRADAAACARCGLWGSDSIAGLRC